MFGNDIWALGVTLYVMAFRKLPFNHTNTMKLFELIEKANVVYSKQRKISEQLKDLIQKMLEKKPEKRIKMKDLIAHPWINKDCSSLQEEIDQLKLN